MLIAVSGLVFGYGFKPVDAASAQAAASPSSLSWNKVAVGNAGGQKTVTLTNSGSGSISINSIGFTGTNAGDFAVFSTTCGSTLAASGSCTANIIFTPTSTGTRTATLNFDDSDGSSPQQVSLTGLGTGAVSATPGKLSFGSTNVGSTSASQTIMVTNGTTSSVTLSAAGLSDQNDFSSSSTTCGSTLGASASCTANIVFTPSTSGTLSSTWSITSSASSSPLTTTLTGTGASVSVTPGSLSFSSTNVGSTSGSQIITVTNGTASPVTLSATGLSGANAGDFSVSSTTCGSTLAVSTSCTAAIVFKPAASGTRSATWSITSSASSTPLTVTLTGTATVYQVALNPSSYDFPSQGAGSVSPPVAFTLKNGQSGTLTISGISISNTGFTQTNNCGSSLAAGASCAISVEFAPKTAGAQSATLSVSDNASGSPQTASLTGNDTAVTVKVKPQNFAYGPQILGRPSDPQSVTVSNSSVNPVTISSIAESGSAFTTTNTCIPNGSSTGTLAGGASCSISAIFDPSTVGSAMGSVTITTSSPSGEVAIPMAGTGEVGDTAPSMVVTPQSSCILPGQSQQFAATLRNTSTSANWYVNKVLGGNSSNGTISPNGLYVAPSSTGRYQIEAYDKAAALYVTTTIGVTTNPTYAIYPYTASLPYGGQQTFQAQLCGVPDSDSVTYSVDNIPGGNSTVGTVTSDGIYTAPAAAGTHIVRVTDSVLNKTSGGVVTVFSGITVDFGSRTNQKYPIRAGILGVNHVDGLHNPSDMGMIAQAGVALSRTYANIQTVYATQTPDWTKIDPLITKLQAQGMHVLMEIALTPPWLQPNPNPCGAGNTAVAPTNVNSWAQIAASYVAHMDANFPGVVTDYEIENEPNTAGALCGTTDKLDEYLSIYAAAAPLMKQQAAEDGATIRVGGPTTAGVPSNWISALLSNSSTAPYVDFVSYHDYELATAGVDAAWDTYNGNDSIYDVTQSAEAGRYSEVASLVAAGKQPGGATTPIYVDEYNINSAFVQNCCQNDPTYSPIWNALYVSDQLDQVYYRGTAAVPQQLTYYAANAYPYFCMIGTWDSEMDCQYTQGSTPVPYPQYYAFQLMGHPDYLGLNSGGYMAASVSPGFNAGGIETTAFYTAKQDSILIVNPTSTAYSNITVIIENSGFSSPSGNLFEVVNGNSISSSSITLTPSGSGYTASISVPPYTVLGISIQGP